MRLQTENPPRSPRPSSAGKLLRGFARLPALIGLFILITSCRGGPAECPGDAPAAKAERAAAAEAQLVALGAGYFTVASFDVVAEERVRWQDPEPLDGASTEEKRLVFYRVRFEAELVLTGVEGPRGSFPASLQEPTWDAVSRNAALLRVGLPPRSAVGDRVEAAAWAIFDVTGPETTRFRGFDDQERDQLVPHEGCPDGRGGRL